MNKTNSNKNKRNNNNNNNNNHITHKHDTAHNNNSRKKKQQHRLQLPNVCNKKMSFQECEMAVVGDAVKAIMRRPPEFSHFRSTEIKQMFKVLESFLIRKKLICYGGTAINNILPKQAQFYDKDIDLPDYDVYSPNAMTHAKQLADLFLQHGYGEVEARAGMHVGTFKVYVNFLPVADITQLHPVVYRSLLKECITIAGVRYASANFLRMNMFQELSRPKGDVSRWEKVMKRLILLNTYYPFIVDKKNCSRVKFQRKLESNRALSKRIFFLLRDSFIEQEAVFFGGFASSLYAQLYSTNAMFRKQATRPIPDFDVFHESPEVCASVAMTKLTESGITNCKIQRRAPIGEILPLHFLLMVGSDLVAIIFAPDGCRSYNRIHLSGHGDNEKEACVATIDTMLQMYLAFTYTSLSYFNKERILCMAAFLFDIQQQNRLSQKGLLHRFTMSCYGQDQSIVDLRAEKARYFMELRDDPNSKDYEERFLKYNPAEKETTSTAETKPTKIDQQISHNQRYTRRRRHHNHNHNH